MSRKFPIELSQSALIEKNLSIDEQFPDNDSIRINTINIIAQIYEEFEDFDREATHFDAVHSLLCECLQSHSSDIFTKSCKLFRNTAVLISSKIDEEGEESDTKNELNPLIFELMKRAIEGCCSDNLDSDNLDQVFVFINEIISDLSFTFVNDLKEIWIQFISRVVLNEDYSKETRLVASEIIGSFASKNQKLVRKAYELNEIVLKSLFEMLLDIPYQENISEWLAILNEKVEKIKNKNCLFYRTKDTLSEYAIAIGEHETMRICIELVKTKIQNQDWKQRFAAFTFLSMTLEGCKNSLKNKIEDILKLIMLGVSDEHPRIKHAGLICLGLFITDQTPKIQKNYHSEIFPQILNTIRDDPELKIKYIAVCVMINFLSDLNEIDDRSETIDEFKAENIVNLYTVDLVDIFVNILNNEQGADSIIKDSLHSQIFLCLFHLSNSINSKLIPFLPILIPYLKKFIVKVSAIECAANIVVELLKTPELISEYKDDFVTIVDAIMDEFFQGSFIDMTLDDETKEKVITLKSNCFINLPSFANILGDEFIPYAEKLLKFIKGVFEKDVTVLCGSGSSDNDADTIFEEADTFEISCNCAQTLMLLVNNLEKRFQPFIEDNMSLILSENIWSFEPRAMKYIYECCSKMIVFEESLERKKFYLGKVIPRFKEKIKELCKELEFDQLLNLIKFFKGCFKSLKATNVLSLPEIESIFELLNASILVGIQFKEAEIKTYEELGDLKTEQDLILLKQNLDKYDKLIHYCSDFHENIVKTLVKTETASDIVNFILFDSFMLNINKSINTDGEVQTTQCFLCDCIDMLSDSFILERQEEIIKQFIHFSNDGILNMKRDYIQTIVYGIGSCAVKFSTELFELHAEVLIKTLINVIDAPGSRLTANAESTENAISSLFRICIYKSDCKYVTNDYLVKILKLLPLISEEIEAKSINGLFLKKYKERDPILFEEDDINADLVEDLKNRMKEYITLNPNTEVFTKEDIEYLFSE